MQTRKILIITAITISAALLFTLSMLMENQDIAPPINARFYEEQDVLEIARTYVLSSPTFMFDGINRTLSIELVSVSESLPPQYIVKASFDSLHGGYGDRTGAIVTQVITPHIMEIIVIEGKVVSAIIDERWDEINQTQYLPP